MSGTRITDLVANLHSNELTRRDLMVKAGVAGMSASALSMLLTGRAIAAPGASTPRYLVSKIDATTLVVTDALSGAYWLGLDPAWYYEINPTMAMFAIYDQLYAGQDGSNPTDIQPLLADGMPELSEDLLTATIKLKQGITFQNTGNEMTADDVIFSYNRLAATYAQSSFLATDYWTDIQKVDDYTIAITLPAPNAGLAAVLASIPLSITDSKQVMEFGGTTDRPEFTDDATDDERASNESILANRDAQNLINSTSVGTGPFKVDQWDTNSSVILVANPDYWGEAPQIEQIIFTNIIDANAQLQAVETGDADIAYSLNPDSVAAVESNPDLQIISESSLSIQYLAMNLNEEFGGPMANQLCRQAFAYAIDYDSIINDILVGGAVRPALPMPLPLSGSEAMLEKAYTLDLARAQELWDESGVGDQEIEITYDSDSPGEGGVNLETLATAIKANLEAINGVTIRLSPMPGNDRVGQYRAGEFQATISPWSPDYPDVDTYATPFFQTGTAAAARVSFSNPEVDDLLKQGLAETDPAARDAIYLQIQELVLPDVPYIVLYQPVYRKPANATVAGVTVHPIYMMNLRGASKTE
ncbi:MAG: ABC transporter substrate-binding protein [Thermomicrobiales bacterium]|nr:ABC transporter substrate-binding protein [Thermomicrobiales bacterium]